jgi:hypothetical protein
MFKFSSRYAHYFREFGNQENSKSTLLKPSGFWDTDSSSYGPTQYQQKICKENYCEKIVSDAMFNQTLPYKTPFLCDDVYKGRLLSTVLQHDKSLKDSCVSSASENQNTSRSVSSILSALEAGRNGVTVESVTKT